MRDVPRGNRVWGTQGGCDMITRLFTSNHGTAEPYPERGDSLSNIIVLHGFPRDSSRGPRGATPRTPTSLQLLLYYMAHRGTLHPDPYSGTPVTAQLYQTMAPTHCLSRHSCQCTNFGTASPRLPPITDQATVFINFTGLYGNCTEFFKNRIKIP